MTSTDQDRQTPAPQAPSRRYSNYVLGVLVLVYVFNFIDRQILSILAEDIRNDLGVSDAQLGFLYGTAFAVFYAIFGIPLGRLADMWTRKSLISVGLAGWQVAFFAVGRMGVAGGGYFSDWMKQKTAKARPLCGLIIALASIPLGAFFVLTESVTTAYVVNFVYTVIGSAWIGSAVALANDLVLPRMRGTASAFYILMVTFVGLALGPFLMGWLSTTLEAGGADSGRSLQLAMVASLGAYVLGGIFFWLAGRSVAAEESSRIERAQAAGEVVEAA